MKTIKKHSALFVLFCIISLGTSAQEVKPFTVYNTSIDPFQQITEAQQKAKLENKNILVQVGGNWCVWCRAFYKFSAENKAVDSTIKKDFVVIHINYSKENKNEAFLKKYQNPNRFGFPVFLILDENASLLHIQDSGYLEEGKGYSEEKIVRFLSLWNPYYTNAKAN